MVCSVRFGFQSLKLKPTKLFRYYSVLLIYIGFVQLISVLTELCSPSELVPFDIHHITILHLTSPVKNNEEVEHKHRFTQLEKSI